MSHLIDNKIDITVLITSISQREVTIKTANYYAEICSEVILVDEEQPHLSIEEINAIKKRGITYISYNSNGYKNSNYEKRKIAASHSNNIYLVHSNHDERYTRQGLIACLAELEKDINLAFCAGQAIAIRRNNSKIYFTKSYENLNGYMNTDTAINRLYYHANQYAPLAHYSVWRKKHYISATTETLKIHDSLSSSNMLDEVIFEFASDLTGRSKTVPELFWIRNRINPPAHGTQEYRDKGKQVFKITEKKLFLLFQNLENVQITKIMNGLWINFQFVRTDSFLNKTIICPSSRLYS